ncbi:hypothetical protein [Pseudoduganella sp. GCM10020061]|uniref:hypothetical protein n=1 Tax=Pseudoduganella sp. GCM10020061 TaxID=3317345 RepID=UPI0036353456
MYRRALLALFFLFPAMSYAADTPELSGADGCRVVNSTGHAGARATWTGGCRDGYAEGRGTLTWHDRRKKLVAQYEGGIKAGLMHGDGYLRLSDGSQYEGGFAEGRYHGKGTLLSMHGRYDGDFVAGSRTGKGKMVFAMGGRYEGQWLDGEFHGTGTALYPSGRTVTAEWVKGMRADLAALPELDPTHKIRSDKPLHGSRMRWNIASGGTVPFAKTYADMSESEQKEVRSWFPLIDDGDEPAYPLKGTKPIYTLFAEGLSVIEEDSEGMLTMYVDIDAEGNPTKASVFATPNKDIANFAMMVVLKHKFKPAICAGKPCASKYPFSIMFSYQD